MKQVAENLAALHLLDGNIERAMVSRRTHWGYGDEYISTIWMSPMDRGSSRISQIMC